jgi:hypothetical protein
LTEGFSSFLRLRSRRQIRTALWILLAGVALYRAWTTRFELINDTVSYLDMGDELFAGRVSGLVNGTWGPAYALILATWLRFLHVGPEWEYPAIHALLWLVLLACLCCFDWFLVQLFQFKARLLAEEGNRADEVSPVPEKSLTIIAYAIFGWAILFLIGVEETNPDILLALFFILASACVLWIHNRASATGRAIALGAAIAGGYLTKAVMLPLGLVLIAAAASAAVGWRGRVRIASAALLTTALLSLPYIVGLSVQRGRFTTNETGTYNYAIAVQGVTYQHWQGETPGAGRPLHPTRKLLDSPAVFEFDGPLPGTYPYWYDPSYWYDGVQRRIVWRSQLQMSAWTFSRTAGLLFGNNASFLAGIVILFLIGARSPGQFSHARRFWIVIIPALAGLLAYLIVHWETRYLGGFLCVLLTSATAAAKLPATRVSRQIYGAVAGLTALMFVAPFGPSTTLAGLGVYRAMIGERPHDENHYWEVAQALQRAGFGPGTKVATTDHALMESVMWARVARMKIIAEVYYRADRPETLRNDFWAASGADQERVLDVFRRTGARLAVTSELPKGEGARGWKRLAGSRFYYMPL